jgi:hypothetical protein
VLRSIQTRQRKRQRRNLPERQRREEREHAGDYHEPLPRLEMRCLYVQRPEADEARDDLGWDAIKLISQASRLQKKSNAYPCRSLKLHQSRKCVSEMASESRRDREGGEETRRTPVPDAESLFGPGVEHRGDDHEPIEVRLP